MKCEQSKKKGLGIPRAGQQDKGEQDTGVDGQVKLQQTIPNYASWWEATIIKVNQWEATKMPKWRT